MNNAISLEISNVLKEKYSYLNKDEIFNEIGNILSKYKITEKEIDTRAENDFNEKISLFCLDKKINGLNENTISNYNIVLKRFSSFVNKNVCLIESSDIRRFLSFYSENFKVKNSTLSNILCIIKSFFSWIINEGYSIKDPAKIIKNIKIKKSLRRSLSDQEVELLKDSCINLRDRALLEFMLSSGCRLNEASQLNIGSIDWSNMSAIVIGKGNKERSIRFNTRAKYHLLKYIKSRPKNGDDQPLFANSKSPYNRLANRSIQKEFEKIVKNARLPPNICLHMTRHTTASKMIRNGASIITVQKTLGHSDPNTTMCYITQDSNSLNYEYDKYMS